MTGKAGLVLAASLQEVNNCNSHSATRNFKFLLPQCKFSIGQQGGEQRVGHLLQLLLAPLYRRNHCLAAPTAKPTLKKSLFILGTKGKVVSFADESDKEDKTGKSVENQEQCTVQFRFKNFTKTKKIFFLLFKVHFSFGTTSFFFISFSVLGIRCKFFSGCA